MGEIGRRLIRDTGWAFRLLGLLIGRSAGRSGLGWAAFVFCFFVFSAMLAAGDDARTAGTHHHHSAGATASSSWEGSPQGIAYSETNHHLAGILVLLIGFSELRQALGLQVLAWTRVLLPLSLITAGVFLLIWSDHEAWPIGSLSLAQTLSGQDPEMLQHKTYGILALAVGVIELLRRLGPMRHSTWAVPLPLFAIVGGLMLFSHTHGDHPAAHKIQLHHMVMGLLAVTAGSSKLVSGWRRPAQRNRLGGAVPANSASGWELAWAGLILLIGVQLLFYSE
jgi:putative copper resistance protein D